EFDLLVSRLQTELVQGSDKVEGLKDELLTGLGELPMSLNQVRARAETIAQVKTAGFWEGVTPAALEEVRHKLRGTMQDRVRPTRPATSPKVFDIREDSALIESRVRKVKLDDLDKAAYRSRVLEALQKLFAENAVLQKIKAGQPVSADDLGTLAALVL